MALGMYEQDAVHPLNPDMVGLHLPSNAYGKHCIRCHYNAGHPAGLTLVSVTTNMKHSL